MAVTVEVYYELYAMFGVAPSILAHYGMTFRYFLTINVVGAVAGALASLAAGFADRWGRANLVVYGTLIASLLLLVGLPEAPDKTSYLVLFAVLSIVEGVILVATPALVRDFSPQFGRATAMAFWNTGPILGTLATTAIVNATFKGSTTWQDELRYSGIAGLVVFAAALVGLRELSPRLRDQIMVSTRDRALVEARARGIETSQESGSHWRQMLSLDILGSSLGAGLFLLLYFAAIGTFVVYLGTAFGYSEQRSNALLNWFWVGNLVGTLAAGLLSDFMRVRKPFILIGGLGTLAATTLFILRTGGTPPGYYTFAWLLLAIGALYAIAYAPRLAAFTETVERRNPAATATGLAMLGGSLRAVVAASAFLLPLVVTSVTPLVQYGPQVQTATQQAAPALAVIDAHPQLFSELAKYPPGAVPSALAQQAVQEVGPKDLAVVQKAQPQLAVLKQHGAEVQHAAKDIGGQWRTWWWVCAGGQLLFLPFAFLMTGRWRPREARADDEAHRRNVERELAALSAQDGTVLAD
ncbi:MFS transporter [Streptomyces sp. NPDC052309]|uniref:MFS transporter n=1 Tax=Streptomyces sp. NPDC052309 TaxID=3155421 RepID=UPI003434B9DE